MNNIIICIILEKNVNLDIKEKTCNAMDKTHLDQKSGGRE